MDTLSHGLYGGVAFGRKTHTSYWKAFAVGIAPDIFSFGIFTASTILGLASGPDWSGGPPDPTTIPQYVHALYDVTHSLVIAFGVIGIVWFVFKKRIIELFAWPLHILIDIPTHSSEFFPTPFLWPLSDYHFNGVSWGTPFVFYTNLAILAVLYIHFFITKRKKSTSEDTIC